MSQRAPGPCRREQRFTYGEDTAPLAASLSLHVASVRELDTADDAGPEGVGLVEFTGTSMVIRPPGRSLRPVQLRPSGPGPVTLCDVWTGVS